MSSEQVVVRLEDLYAQFKERAMLEAQVTQLTEKIQSTGIQDPGNSRDPGTDVPKAEKPKKERKSKYATEEERKEAMRQNGLRLAAANKAKREAEKAALGTLPEPETTEQVEAKPKKERKTKPKAEPELRIQINPYLN